LQGGRAVETQGLAVAACEAVGQEWQHHGRLKGGGPTGEVDAVAQYVEAGLQLSMWRQGQERRAVG